MSQEVVENIDVTTTLEPIDIGRAQREDDDLAWWIPYIKDSIKPQKDQVSFSPVATSFYRNFDKLVEENGTIYRKTVIDGQERKQLVVPKSHIVKVLKLAHNDMGHQGRDKTTSLVRDRFFWCGMTKDIEDFIKGCDRCIKRKTPTTGRAPLVNIVTHEPLELVCMDFLSLETSKGGFQNILVITDHFTRYAVAIPTRNQTARTTAEAFMNNFVVHYGLPRRIHSDQGANFESHLMKEICNITGMEKSHTTPYHAMGNGLCERMNRSLLDMLGTLQPEAKKDWKSHVAPLVHAYNCTRQDSTGQSPYSLMFGRDPNLPMDLVFGLESTRKDVPRSKYAADLKQRLREAYRIATANSNKARDRQKNVYDRRVRSAAIEPGDLVLVKIVAFDGKHKLSDKWEEEPYVVLSKPNDDIPVYTVQKQSGEGRRRTLHRNLLLPITTLGNAGKDFPTDERPRPIPRRRQKPEQKLSVTEADASSKEAESDEDSEAATIIILDQDVQTDVEPQDDVSTSDTTTVQSEAEDEGDAPSSEQEASENDEEQPSESGDDQAEAERQHTPPRPAPRRSERTRRPPNWLQSGDYVMSLQNQPEWVRRAEYLRTIPETTTFKDYRQDVMEAILKVVTNGT